jgi:hypothetical protein
VDGAMMPEYPNWILAVVVVAAMIAMALDWMAL